MAWLPTSPFTTWRRSTGQRKRCSKCWSVYWVVLSFIIFCKPTPLGKDDPSWLFFLGRALNLQLFYENQWLWRIWGSPIGLQIDSLMNPLSFEAKWVVENMNNNPLQGLPEPLQSGSFCWFCLWREVQIKVQKIFLWLGVAISCKFLFDLLCLTLGF